MLRQRLAAWLVGGASAALVLASVPTTALAEPSPSPSPSGSPSAEATPLPDPAASPEPAATPEPAGSPQAPASPALPTSHAAAVATKVTIAMSVTNLRTIPDSPRRTLTGKVTDTAGQPVSGLLVTVKQRTNGASWRHFADKRTGSDGRFAFRAASGRAKYVQYVVRSTATDAYVSSVSGTVRHELRYDPLDQAQRARMARAVRAGGLKVGVGMVDRKTGRTYDYGHRQSTFYTASVAKVIVAMDVLRDHHARGRSAPTDADARKIRSMIRNSNDAITWAYWRSRGGAAVVARVGKRCGTSIAVHNDTWSMSRPSPVQMAKVLDCLADHRALNAGLSGFLLRQMRNVTPSQRWGVPAANPDQFRTEMNKNGWWRWPCCYFWTVNSTGVFGPGNRYAFTVFTEYGGSLPQSRGERQARDVTRAMFPWGTIVY